MATKKYLSLERLGEYDELIKAKIDSGDASTLSSAKSYADSLANGKADKTHTHDDRYYTESEIDTKFANITNGTTVVKKAEEANHATSADSATSSTNADKLGGQLPSYYAKASDIPTGALAKKSSVSESDLDSALAEKVNAASEGNHSHSNKTVLDGITSAKVSAWDSAESNAKTYADTAATNAATKVKNDLLNGAGTAYDTLKELGDLIVDNADAIDALETIASGKANATHSHAISEVTNLQSTLDAKATQTALDELAEVVDGKADKTHTHEGFVSYVDNQTLTDDQKIIARDNIGAISENDLKVKEFPIYNTYETSIGGIITMTYARVNLLDLEHNGYFYDAGNGGYSSMFLVVPCEDGTYKNVCSTTPEAYNYRIVHSGTKSYIYSIDSNEYITVDHTDKSTANNIVVTKANYKYLGISNTIEYIPTANYHPATKKYVDDSVANIDLSTYETTTNVQLKLDEAKAYADTKLEGKADAAHIHSIANVTNLQSTLDTMNANINGKAASTHSHTISEITNLQTTLNNAASAISANTGSITALQEIVNSFEEITSDEIRALFNA